MQICLWNFKAEVGETKKIFISWEFETPMVVYCRASTIYIYIYLLKHISKGCNTTLLNLMFFADYCRFCWSSSSRFPQKLGQDLHQIWYIFIDFWLNFICISYAFHMHFICISYAFYMHFICILYAFYMHFICTFAKCMSF